MLSRPDHKSWRAKDDEAPLKRLVLQRGWMTRHWTVSDCTSTEYLVSIRQWKLDSVEREVEITAVEKLIPMIWLDVEPQKIPLLERRRHSPAFFSLGSLKKVLHRTQSIREIFCPANRLLENYLAEQNKTHAHTWIHSQTGTKVKKSLTVIYSNFTLKLFTVSSRCQINPLGINSTELCSAKFDKFYPLHISYIIQNYV